MSYFNLIETDGIFRSAEEIENYRTADGKLIQPGAQVGDVRYKDWNGDGSITTDDQHDVGSPFPDMTFYRDWVETGIISTLTSSLTVR